MRYVKSSSNVEGVNMTPSPVSDSYVKLRLHPTSTNTCLPHAEAKTSHTPSPRPIHRAVSWLYGKAPSTYGDTWPCFVRSYFPRFPQDGFLLGLAATPIAVFALDSLPFQYYLDSPAPGFSHLDTIVYRRSRGYW
jgi:hypothetical protein